jgi:hypothetical protein
LTLEPVARCLTLQELVASGHDDGQGRRVAMSSCVAGITAATGEVTNRDAAASELGLSDSELAICPPSVHVVCIPITGFGRQTIGVLQAARRTDAPPFSGDDVQLLEVRASAAVHTSPVLSRSICVPRPITARGCVLYLLPLAAAAAVLAWYRRSLSLKLLSL